ncbi:hypothetical protein LTR10_021507 [Elasticomyces elasticus]|uniref:Uncharacterized protein n=1 Tax=Exophiala sideris TaxID=1016849 RepID=A0ABR0J9A6_9EURO|nr:hypothetical protein LTR10_021507 [Elasticomyces elasticus]KAK5027963.1 hypothetical protein LTS07_006839 [Exophiala sideris]KAK5037446.1 hypothetical protein LTR13_004603 [Exophiala sideris]KAK5059107.1 hypothetical protein LTR69_006396 [Exophiala sideris]KAK5182941.1 hypothetical protein LTR44_004651 [Eurotiomycetes sp. CCFEE 6388]
MLFKIDVAFATRPTWVERLSTDRLCLVRKRWNSPRPKRTEYMEVYEDVPEHDYYVEPDRPQQQLHQHNHNHQHFVHYDRPSVAPPPDVQVEVNVDKPQRPATPPPSPTFPRMANQGYSAPPPSPFREMPQPQRQPDPVRYRQVPVERVRVQRIQSDVARHHHRRPSVRRQSNEANYVYMPVREHDARRHEASSSRTDPETAVWDENLAAFVVRRTPRVRFD